jgi:hypothetical protein
LSQFLLFYFKKHYSYSCIFILIFMFLFVLNILEKRARSVESIFLSRTDIDVPVRFGTILWTPARAPVVAGDFSDIFSQNHDVRIGWSGILFARFIVMRYGMKVRRRTSLILVPRSCLIRCVSGTCFCCCFH